MQNQKARGQQRRQRRPFSGIIAYDPSMCGRSPVSNEKSCPSIHPFVIQLPVPQSQYDSPDEKLFSDFTSTSGALSFGDVLFCNRDHQPELCFFSSAAVTVLVLFVVGCACFFWNRFASGFSTLSVRPSAAALARRASRCWLA